MGKNSKSSRDLDLERTMPNVELIRGLFISYNIFEFQDPRPFIFLSYRAYTQTDRQTDRHTPTQTDRQTDRQTTETSTLYLRSRPQV